MVGNGIFDKNPSPDKPEVVAEETVVHAGVGHQAILVCQVVYMFLMIGLLVLLMLLMLLMLLIFLLSRSDSCLSTCC